MEQVVSSLLGEAMPDIFFKCGKCEKHLVVDDVGAGTKINCPDCNNPIVIPMQGIRRLCPHCKQDLNFTSGMIGERVHCSACKNELELSSQNLPKQKKATSSSSQSKADPPKPQGSTEIATCPKCHKQFVGHVLVCSFCRYNFLTGKTEVREAEKSRSTLSTHQGTSGGLYGLWIGILVCSWLALFVYSWIGYDDPKRWNFHLPSGLLISCHYLALLFLWISSLVFEDAKSIATVRIHLWLQTFLLISLTYLWFCEHPQAIGTFFLVVSIIVVVFFILVSFFDGGSKSRSPISPTDQIAMLQRQQILNEMRKRNSNDGF